MTSPEEPRFTAAWWTIKYNLPEERDALLALGLTAFRIARWYGIEEAKVVEGPYWVHTWPARIWAEAVALITGTRAR
jgi:hypothetical protein